MEDKYIDRFWLKVDRKGPYPDRKKYPKLKKRCMLWTAAVNRDGYGCFWDGTHNRMAHVIAYELATGLHIERGGDILICHHCDNPSWVEHTHLFSGSHADNVHDMLAKGRGRKAKPKSYIPTPRKIKLPRDKIVQIRKMYASREYTQLQLARLFAVSDTAINFVLKGRLNKASKHQR